MTLFELVAAGGIVSSFALLFVLTSLWPVRRHRCVFTMSTPEHGPQDAPVVIANAPVVLGNAPTLVDGARLAAGGAPT